MPGFYQNFSPITPSFDKVTWSRDVTIGHGTQHAAYARRSAKCIIRSTNIAIVIEISLFYGENPAIVPDSDWLYPNVRSGVTWTFVRDSPKI